MKPNQQTPSPTIDFETSAMFDAHGFKRGELLKPQFPHLNGTDLRELLAKVVERHVLPQLDQAVQVMVIPSARNPVRATRVNGQEVVWHNAEAGTGPQVTPAVVQVSEAAIRDCLDKAKQKPVPADNIDDLELEAAAG